MPSTASFLPVAVIKLGGALLADLDVLRPFWEAVQRLRETASVVLVHGGGPQINDLARQLGHEPRIVQGRRITTERDLELVLMTLRGTLNTRLVAAAQRQGLPAAGLSGVDGQTVQVVRRPPRPMGDTVVDFGWVGDVTQVETALLRTLLAAGYLPVLAPLGLDPEGLVYNVNADTVACQVAGALGATTLLLATETGGVRRNADDPASLLSVIDTPTFTAGVAAGWISGGMRVKLEVAFEACATGIPEVWVLAASDVQARTQATRVTR
jgi:acetylglutamate kinase